MKFKTIPEPIRKARTALLKRWLGASLEERRRLIPPVPKSSIIPRVANLLLVDPKGIEIEAKEKEISTLKAQVSDLRAQASALDFQCEQVKRRVIALARRKEEIELDEATAPARGAAIAESLGFGSRIPKTETESQTTEKPKL